MIDDEQLQQRLVPLIEELVTELAPRLVERIAPIVRELAREHLRGVLDQLGAGGEAAPIRAKGQRNGRAPIAKPVAAKKPGPGRGQAPGACSKCGERGHNARTCGKPKTKSDDEDEPARAVVDDPEPPPPYRASSPSSEASSSPAEQLEANQPPPGWTPEIDRHEEAMSLSWLYLEHRWSLRRLHSRVGIASTSST